MNFGTISAGVYTPIVLGEHGYGATLTVTSTGLIAPPAVYNAPSTYGLTGLEVRTRLSGATIINNGTINGSGGNLSYANRAQSGGSGVDVRAHGVLLDNSGTIAGGAGGYGTDAGTALTLLGAGSTVTNAGAIFGGVGNYGFASTGGVGVNDVAPGIFTNDGLIAGGQGSSVEQGAQYVLPGLAGGLGLNLNGRGAVVLNAGTIIGGSGGASALSTLGEGAGGVGGAGADVSHHANLSNTGTLFGGTGGGGGAAGGVGVDVATSGTLTNGGLIAGGTAGQALGSPTPVYARSGDGLVASAGAVVSNSGTIAGGGSYERTQYAGAGAGATLTSAVLTNTGLIAGGSANITGATNLPLAIGGNGVDLAGLALLTNTGTITGGTGYIAGTGLQLAGGKAVNTGIILGGDVAGPAGQTGGAAGAGAILTGGTLINAGTIGGGMQGGIHADAVLIAGGAATLAITSTAVFDGAVQAGASDTLALDGKSAGTLSGLGSAFSGFGTLQVAGNSTWTVTGPATLEVGSTLLDNGALTASGSLADAGSATLGVAGVLAGEDGATIQINALTLAGGRIAGAAGVLLAIGGSLAGSSAGNLTVDIGAAIAGFGAISIKTGGGTIVDNGTITASGGTLSVAVPLTGSGTFAIAHGATAITGGAVQVPSVAFSGSEGTLVISRPAALTATISGFGTGDAIELDGKADSHFTFGAGTLTLLSNGAPDGTLVFAGDYTAANFAVSDGTISFVPLGITGHTKSPDHAASAMQGVLDQPISHNIIGGWLPSSVAIGLAETTWPLRALQPS
jgi:hypothetical protein